MNQQLSSEMLHASTVAKDGRAVVICGLSGSGKSDLALRLLDRGFVLVSDDQTMLSKHGGKLLASAPDTIRGKLEVRGIGIVEVENSDGAVVSLIVELGEEIERFPEVRRERDVLGVKIPVVGIDPAAASAPQKVELALKLFGLGTE